MGNDRISNAPESAPPTEHVRAKLLERRGVGGPAHVPARMIGETVYCERLMYLEWAQGEWADNAFTIDGRSVHKRVDHPKGSLPLPESDFEPAQVRSLWLSSDRLGITAKIDVVDVVESGAVIPVEYKRGKSPDVPEGAYLPQRAQLCAQVLLLRDHGYRCESAFIYFAADRRRTEIAITAELEAQTLAAAARARELVDAVEAPPPLDDSPKCYGCSLIGICLPDEVTLLRRKRVADEVAVLDERREVPLAAPDPAAHADSKAAGIRRLHPARDEKLPLYVQEPGARVTLSGETLKVVSRTAESVSVKIPLTSDVSLFGPVQITTQAIHALLREGIPVSFFSTGGWFNGRLVSHESKNVELRISQHAAAADERVCLKLARGFVASKILNSRTLLRRNHHDPSETVLKELKRLSHKALECLSIESLLGLEGTAARTYFGEFSGMFKRSEEGLPEFELDGRNRRPPRDPVNALLSFAYAMLTKDVSLACSKVGLDPMLGFYHQPRFGRPALALDLMEEFRPLVADSTVIGVINNAVVNQKDFISNGVAVSIAPDARKRFIYAYERRMDQLVTHPIFGYRISYRRVLEVQARLLARFLLGEIDAYPEFRTR